MDNKEAMGIILDEMGIKLTDDQIKELTDNFENHLYNKHEMESYSHVGGKTTCTECARLNRELKKAQSDIEIFKDSVKKRRKCEHVWIDRLNNEVTFD